MTTPEPPPEGQAYYAGQPDEPAPYPAEPNPAAQYPAAQYPSEQYPAAQQYPGAPQYPAGPYPQGYPQQPPYPYAYAPARPTNGMAIASMVLGILWIYWIGSILALIFGYVARKEIQRTGANGDGMAVAGIVLGWVGIGILCVVLIVAGAAAWT